MYSGGLEELVNRPRPSAWREFSRGPFVFVARHVYACQRRVPAEPPPDAVSVVCVSDTHNRQPQVPHGDVLVHAGDLTQGGTLQELQAAVSWLDGLSHPHKIVVGGNHDLWLDRGRQHSQLNWGDITYLNDESATIACANGRQLSVYGSPRSPQHGNWAFQYPRSEDVWSGSVPQHVDILVTHGPPRAHLDMLGLGCTHLLDELWRTRPRLHVFGHVHEGYGTEWLKFDALQEAFERVVINGGGFWSLLRLFHRFVRGFFETSHEARCRLVNASHVGGLRDELCRAPVVVFV